MEDYCLTALEACLKTCCATPFRACGTAKVYQPLRALQGLPDPNFGHSPPFSNRLWHAVKTFPLINKSITIR
jgi:hypothetical protein